jgi:hypothetical protein
MSDPVQPDDRMRGQRWSDAKPDLFGRNIPPNERVIRREKWQPEFTPLGESEPVRPAEVEEQASPAQPFSPPQDPAWVEPARAGSRRRHGRRHSWSAQCMPGAGPFPWLFIVVMMVALGWIGHVWWLIFFLWPLGFLFKGLLRGRPSTLGVILIAAGVLLGLSTLGLTGAVLLPLVLIAGGLVMLLRTLQAPTRI